MENYSDAEPFVPYSKTMNRILYSLDHKLLEMEELIEDQKAEIKSYRDELSQVQNQRMREGNQMVANTLMSFFAPTFDMLTPAGANMLIQIKQFGTIEEVHHYVDEMIERSKEKMKKEESEDRSLADQILNHD